MTMSSETAARRPWGPLGYEAGFPLSDDRLAGCGRNRGDDLAVHRPDESGRGHDRRGRPGRHRHPAASARPADRGAVGGAAGVRRQARPARARRAQEPEAARRPARPRTRRSRSSRPTPRTGAGRSSPRFWCSSGCAPISAAFRCSTPPQTRPTRRPIGRAASSAPATARNTISPAGCSRAFPRPTTSPCRPIISPTTRRFGSAKIRRAQNFDFNSILQV